MITDEDRKLPAYWETRELGIRKFGIDRTEKEETVESRKGMVSIVALGLCSKVDGPRDERASVPSVHGVTRFGSRGNMDVLRMLSRPRNSIVTRSRPATHNTHTPIQIYRVDK